MRRLSKGKIPWWPVANGKYRSITHIEINKLLGHQSHNGKIDSNDWKKLI